MAKPTNPAPSLPNLDVRTIMRDPKNGLGEFYKPDYQYSVLDKKHSSMEIADRLNNGWTIIADDVAGGDNSEVFVLLGRPRDP